MIIIRVIKVCIWYRRGRTRYLRKCTFENTYLKFSLKFLIKITPVLFTNQMHYTAQLSRVTSYFGNLFGACLYFCVKKKFSANLWDAANKVIIKCAAFQICLIYHHFFHLHLNLVRLYFFCVELSPLLLQSPPRIFSLLFFFSSLRIFLTK